MGPWGQSSGHLVSQLLLEGVQAAQGVLELATVLLAGQPGHTASPWAGRGTVESSENFQLWGLWTPHGLPGSSLSLLSLLSLMSLLS